MDAGVIRVWYSLSEPIISPCQRKGVLFAFSLFCLLSVFGQSSLSAQQSGPSGVTVAGGTLESSVVQITWSIGELATCRAYNSDQSSSVTQGTLQPLMTVKPKAGVTDFRVDIFPNPTSESLHIRLSEPAIQTISVVLLDASGQELRQQIVAGQEQLTWDLGAFPAGTYFLRLSDEAADQQQRQTFTIVKSSQ